MTGTGSVERTADGAVDGRADLREALEGLLEAEAPHSWMRRPAAPEGMNVRDASVLMLFGHGTQPRTAAGRDELERLDDLGVSDVDIVLLQRASTLRNHAGQPAFPGGARDAGDGSAAFTALREAEEETGLDPAGVDVVGTLEPLYVPPSRFDVTPVVGWWREPTSVAAVDQAESALVARVAIADLVAPGNRGTFSPADRPFSTPVFDLGIMRPWGFTAGLLDWSLETLGWAREWDRERTIHVDF
ncbi:NUDIX domain-containing protein [Brevibacterium sp. Mu109]|uniref:NUDIX hydrolase n=1 Tax=Brevibacterium sp. Mu109 TaxID=1255669 RepID=UPI000C57B36E|nr:CoA pyrophosphatase [Brevibacterium sp. Mu109]SMX64646.1 NUDIX domain-containing protein [Brevibacterium sp. Mu109]